MSILCHGRQSFFVFLFSAMLQHVDFFMAVSRDLFLLFFIGYFFTTSSRFLWASYWQATVAPNDGAKFVRDGRAHANPLPPPLAPAAPVFFDNEPPEDPHWRQVPSHK